MDVLVDSSVWIDYFRGVARGSRLDTLLDNNHVVTNDLILTELVPYLKLKKQNTLIGLLQELRRLPLQVDWQDLVETQVLCLRSGNNGVGIPDLIIAQNARLSGSVLYSLDRQLLALAAMLKIKSLSD
jgi:predicted nucleic acid-binding protein